SARPSRREIDHRNHKQSGKGRRKKQALTQGAVTPQRRGTPRTPSIGIANNEPCDETDKPYRLSEGDRGHQPPPCLSDAGDGGVRRPARGSGRPGGRALQERPILSETIDAAAGRRDLLERQRTAN